VIRAYHFVGAKLRDGRDVPPDGEWLVFDGKPEMCLRGLHASKHPFDALQYAPRNTLCLVECDGEIIEGDDKLVCTRRRILARFDAEAMLFEFARKQAMSVIHLWDAPAIVREFLETGDESKRAAARDAARDAAWDAAWAAARDAARDAARAAARDAARDAAWAAARDAAWDAARAAAWDAAWDAAREDFNTSVSAKFREMGVME